jgi:REP element-mobilizing transposase RayT
MLSDDEYDDYCKLIARLKCEQQTSGQQPQRKRNRLPMEAYAASDCDFFMTICAHDRAAAPFLRKPIADGVIESLLWTKRSNDWTLHCYCLMPDHLHFIARLPDSDVAYFDAGGRGVVPKGILDHVGHFKKFTTTQVWWKHGGRDELWQRSGYDHAINYNQSLEPAVRYVLNNPVRKGLVQDWRDYPYSKLVDAEL